MNKTLLILDVQEDFVGEKAKLSVAKHQIVPMIDTINKMVEGSTKNHMDVIYIGNEFEKSQFIFNIFRNFAAIKGTNGIKLDSRLLVVNNHYYSKKQGSAFTNPLLIKYFDENKIEEVIIVGVFAEGCVKATAKDALNRNYNVTLIKDAIAGSNDSKRDKTLSNLSKIGIQIIDYNDFQMK